MSCRRMSPRSSTGSVEASEAPTIAAAAHGSPRRKRDASAMIRAGMSDPGPNTSIASRALRRTSFRSSEIASLNRTSTRPRVAIACNAGEFRSRSKTPRPNGPSTAPSRRKIATCGMPVRSTTPDSSDETRMTIPMSATVAVKLSRVIGVNTSAGRQSRFRRHLPNRTRLRFLGGAADPRLREETPKKRRRDECRHKNHQHQRTVLTTIQNAG